MTKRADIQKHGIIKSLGLILMLMTSACIYAHGSSVSATRVLRPVPVKKPGGNTLPADLLLNGKWQTGINRNYSATSDVPGIAVDQAKMADGKLWYKKEVTLPPGSWENAVLELKGARFLPEVYIDGELVSKQNGGMAPTFHLLQHKNVKPGNKIVIEIALASLKDVPVTDASYIPPADQWRSNISSGLWDDVILHFYNKCRIESAVPFIDFDRHSAVIKLHIRPSADAKELKGQYSVEVLASNGAVLISKHHLVSSESDSLSFQYQQILKAWSPEHPQLYTLRITLTDDQGNTEDCMSMPLGIKKFNIKDKQFYLNNRPCKVSGGTVVWHRWVRSAAGARLGYDTAWFYKNVVRRLKEHGANYLRFHLGKPPEKLLDLCDKYGLLVQYEWSFFHGMPASGSSLQEQYKEWLNIAVRHPCVTFIHPYNETEGSQLDTVWKVLNTLLTGYPPLILEGRDVTHVHKYWWSLFENVGLYYDSYRQFPQAVMVDEFGGNYLDANGGPGAYPTVKESFLRFLGRGASKAMRLQQQELSCAKIAEYWRRTGVAGFAPFCILSSNEDGNNWFAGDLEKGNPKPVWDALTAAWSPQSVSLELWDRNFIPEQDLLLPVYVFNDADKQANLKVRVSVTDSTGKVFVRKWLNADMKSFSREIKKIRVRLPATPGTYNISAELLNPPVAVKYPVVSSWQVHVFNKTLPENLKGIKIAVADNEPELKTFLDQLHITSTTIADKNASAILTSVNSWNKIKQGDQGLPDIFQQAIENGQSVIMLDIGDRGLGQGYPSDHNDLGPLQGAPKVTDPRVNSYDLFGGIKVSFWEAAEPESHIHPAKLNNELWNGIPLQNTWLWNGMRGGLIVPAADMEFSGLNPASFLAQWKTRGGDETGIKKGPYYAYELQGFYAFSTKDDDDAVKKALKQKVSFLVQDAPALAASINPETPVKISNLSLEYASSQKSIASDQIPLADAGKNLTRSPVVMLEFGKGRGKLIASQLLTSGRLVKGSGGKGLYDIRYDEVAVQFVLNMISLSLKNTASE